MLPPLVESAVAPRPGLHIQVLTPVRFPEKQIHVDLRPLSERLLSTCYMKLGIWVSKPGSQGICRGGCREKCS